MILNLFDFDQEIFFVPDNYNFEESSGASAQDSDTSPANNGYFWRSIETPKQITGGSLDILCQRNLRYDKRPYSFTDDQCAMLSLEFLSQIYFYESPKKVLVKDILWAFIISNYELYLANYAKALSSINSKGSSTKEILTYDDFAGEDKPFAFRAVPFAKMSSDQKKEIDNFLNKPFSRFCKGLGYTPEETQNDEKTIPVFMVDLLLPYYIYCNHRNIDASKFSYDEIVDLNNQSKIKRLSRRYDPVSYDMAVDAFKCIIKHHSFDETTRVILKYCFNKLMYVFDLDNLKKTYELLTGDFFINNIANHYGYLPETLEENSKFVDFTKPGLIKTLEEKIINIRFFEKAHPSMYVFQPFHYLYLYFKWIIKYGNITNVDDKGSSSKIENIKIGLNKDLQSFVNYINTPFRPNGLDKDPQPLPLSLHEFQDYLHRLSNLLYPELDPNFKPFSDSQQINELYKPKLNQLFDIYSKRFHEYLQDSSPSSETIKNMKQSLLKNLPEDDSLFNTADNSKLHYVYIYYRDTDLTFDSGLFKDFFPKSEDQK